MKFFDKFKFGKNKAVESDTRTEEQKQALEDAKKLGQQSAAFWLHAIRKGGTGYLRKQLRKHPPKKQPVEEVVKEKKVGKFAGLPTRKERRQAATENEIIFQPQYEGETPYRGQSKKALKVQKNNEVYEEKKKTRRDKIEQAN